MVDWPFQQWSVFVTSYFLFMKSIFLKAALPALLLTVVALAAHAQPGGGGVTPTPTPIDGGASMLLASGVAYGLKRLRERRK